MSECQWPAGWHRLSRHQMPKLVSRSSSQVFRPNSPSLLPTTRHGATDTQTPPRADSGGSNSQARRGLSPASSFILPAHEKRGGPKWRQHVWTEVYILFLSHSLSAQRGTRSDSQCHLWLQGGSERKVRTLRRHRYGDAGPILVVNWC